MLQHVASILPVQSHISVSNNNVENESITALLYTIKFYQQLLYNCYIYECQRLSVLQPAASILPARNQISVSNLSVIHAFNNNTTNILYNMQQMAVKMSNFFIHEPKKHKNMPYLTTRKKLKLQLSHGLVASYNIQPGNGVGLFWETKHTPNPHG